MLNAHSDIWTDLVSSLQIMEGETVNVSIEDPFSELFLMNDLQSEMFESVFFFIDTDWPAMCL